MAQLQVAMVAGQVADMAPQEMLLAVEEVVSQVCLLVALSLTELRS